MHDDQIKDTFKQEEKRRGAPDSNMSYDEQNDNPMEPNEESPKNTPDSVLKPKENIVLEEDNLDHILQANQFVENFFASSVAKNMYETPLAKLIKTGYVLKTIDNSEKAKELEDTATLESAFMTLAETDVIAVMHEHKKVGYLNRQQVMRYLSEVQR